LAGAVRSIVVMGVSGSGKSTIGSEVARRIDAEFIDADWLHSRENLTRMSTEHALNDEERLPWLRSVGQLMEEVASRASTSVVACSSLKRSYRDVLRKYVPDTFFVYLDGPKALIQARMNARRDSFMPTSLLESQFAILEVLQDDERGTSVDVSLSPDEIVGIIVAEWKT